MTLLSDGMLAGVLGCLRFGLRVTELCLKVVLRVFRVFLMGVCRMSGYHLKIGEGLQRQGGLRNENVIHYDVRT